MTRKARVRDVGVIESDEGRFVMTTYDDGSTVWRRVEKDAKPRRKPRKPYARAWRPADKPSS